MSSKTADSAKTRVALEKERVQRQGKQGACVQAS
jgi:hypothetical protein